MSQALSSIQPRPHVRHVAIGVFDGVHLGHQQIFRESLRDLPPPYGAAVLTFEPHPLAVVAPHLAPPRLTLEEQKVALMHRYGMSDVIVVQFDAQLRALSAEEFVSAVRGVFPQMNDVIVGPNWTFGHQRRGTAETLREMGARQGFCARALQLFQLHGRPVSSTRIREAISHRSFAEADEMLGHEYRVEGVVIHGDGRGRTLGFPTANIAGIQQLMPPPGVYAGLLDMGERTWTAVMNYGVRPTFSSGTEPLLEVHLLDFDGDLYDQRISIRKFRFLREERKFAGLEELKAQLQSDRDAAWRLFTTQE